MAHDLVIKGGRVIDPESGLDAIRNVGVTAGRIETISDVDLVGDETVNATGMVVAPGFIDLHSHGQDHENYVVQALDGVTTALELEVGAGDIDAWYEEREGRAAVNFGASVGHIPVRIDVMNDPGDFLPVADAAFREATTDELRQIKEGIEIGLQRGALAVGFGLDYTRGCSRWEALEVFRVAAKYGASCHVHVRGKGHQDPMSSIEAAGEVIAASAISGAPLHIVHVPEHRTARNGGHTGHGAGGPRPGSGRDYRVLPVHGRYDCHRLGPVQRGVGAEVRHKLRQPAVGGYGRAPHGVHVRRVPRNWRNGNRAFDASGRGGHGRHKSTYGNRN